MSAIAWEVRSFALRPSGESFFHQTEGATTTPGRARSETAALRVYEPRSLKTRTRSPLAIPRARASSGWISSRGSFSEASANGRFAKLEFRKLRQGGEMNAKG